MSPFFPSFRSLSRVHWVLYVFKTSTRRRCERGAGSSRSTSQLSTRVIASIAVALSALRLSSAHEELFHDSLDQVVVDVHQASW